MRVLRGLGGVLLWIAALLVGLVAVILCVTVVLLPVGIPLLFLTRRLFTSSIRLMLPRAVAHPVKEFDKSAHKQQGKVKQEFKKAEKGAGKTKQKMRRRFRPTLSDRVLRRRSKL